MAESYENKMKHMKTENPNITDYSNPGHWLSLPTHPSKPADVFYIYPPTFHKADPAESTYCTIDNTGMIKGAAFTFRCQATAFEKAGNIYAPFYRQVDSAYMLTFPAKDRGEIQNIYARMVATYAIGYPVTSKYMYENKHLKFAEGSDDTGVIISYNTQSPTIPAGGNILLGDDIGIVINPINWKRDETPAKASESLGSYMPGADGVFIKVPAYADARIDLAKGALICSSVDDELLDQLFPSTAYNHGVYHIWDFPLYYYNLQENAERRAGKFLNKL